MTALALVHKDKYEELIGQYLSNEFTARETVTAFFHQRRLDNPIDDTDKPIIDRVTSEAWHEIFAELFNACEDVVYNDHEGEPGNPFPITEKEFRQKLFLLLPRIEAFGAIRHEG